MKTQLQVVEPVGRLDSWKEIARYLGRSERTVRRWEEREQLPVHRLAHEKRGSVYAYRNELDQWWKSRGTAVELVGAGNGRSRRWWQAGAAVVVLGAVAGLVSTVANRIPEPRTIVVTTFENSSADPALGYLAEGISGYLTRATRLQVRRGKAAHADLVVQGTVSNQFIRVALIDTRSSTQVWGETFGLDGGVAEVERKIALSIREELLRTTKEPAPPLPEGGAVAVKPEAYRAFLEGRHWCDSPGRVQFRTGLARLEDAVRLDPGFARAHAVLAYSYFSQWIFAEAPAREAMKKAQGEAMRALEIDPSMPNAWTVLGLTRQYLDLDYPAAFENFRRGVAANPRHSRAVNVLGEALMETRRFDEARPHLEHAVELEPDAPGMPFSLALNHLFSGDRVKAEAGFRRILDAEPNYGMARLYLGRCLLMDGKNPAAIEQIRLADQLLGKLPMTQWELGHALGRAGQRAEAERMLATFAQRKRAGYYPAFAFAAVHVGLGHNAEALRWLGRAYEERNTGNYSPNSDPMWDPLRSDPQFRRILAQVRY